MSAADGQSGQARGRPHERPAPRSPDERPAPDPRAGRVRYWLLTLGLRFAVGAYLRLRVSGRERLPAGPAMLCFTHQSWADPFVMVAAIPARSWSLPSTSPIRAQHSWTAISRGIW